jgi:Carboxypeptidase regulatory-like domain
MNNKPFDLNTLRVASPCSVGWDTMTGDERTRHCDACRLNVYNVAELTTAEVKDLVLKSEGSICMRMYRRVDGTILTRDCPAGLRLVRRRAVRFAGATLATVLGLFSISFAQKEEPAGVGASRVNILRTTGGARLSGKVMDENGAVIADARIMVLNGKQEQRVAISSAEGLYDLDSLAPGPYDVTIVAPGFHAYQIKSFSINPQEDVELTVHLRVEMLTGLVLLPSEGFIDRSTTSVKTVITRKMIDSLPN